MNLALFDLDHTLLPIDSDYEWGQFLARIGAVDAVAFEQRNAQFFVQYQDGTLNQLEYLDFALGTLARFSRLQLDALHLQFMHDIIEPAIRPSATDLLQRHQDAGDLVCIVTATNRFVTAPIAQALGVAHLLAAEPELAADGAVTGKLIGVPTAGVGKITHTTAWLAAMDKTLAQFDKSYFYSDSHNDLPLLSVVTHPVATNPNAKLAAHAAAHDWPILKLFHD